MVLMTDEAIVTKLGAMQDRMSAGTFTVSEAAQMYELVQEMRQRADYFERALIRHLRFDTGLTWMEIADAVDANLGSKQAAHAKWKRLIAGDRRVPGGPVLGGRKPAARRAPEE